MDIPDDWKHILIFGGSFDPPHHAHVQLPLAAARSAGADGVVYMPAAVSPLKDPDAQTPAHHRLAMLQLALAGRKGVHISTLEIDDAKEKRPSYTTRTLEKMRSTLPRDVSLRLLIGADQLRQFDRWKTYWTIVRIAEPLVMLRPPDTRESLLASLPEGFEKDEWEPRLVDVPQLDISSSEIRRCCKAGEPFDSYVLPTVAAYIAKHGLYRD